MKYTLPCYTAVHNTTTQNPIFVKLLRVTPMYFKQPWYSQNFTVLISLTILQEKIIDIGISVQSLMCDLSVAGQ